MGGGGSNPLLKNKGVQRKVQNYFLRVVLNLQEMHYIFTKKNFFFLRGMPPDPLSYNMSDVNPHLTQCELPPYLKAGSAPEKRLYTGCLAVVVDGRGEAPPKEEVVKYWVFGFCCWCREPTKGRSD